MFNDQFVETYVHAFNAVRKPFLLLFLLQRTVFLVNDEGVSDNGAAEKQPVLILFNPLETCTVSPFGNLLTVHFNEL